MKKLILAICSVSVLFSACNSSRVASFDDDVYTSPTEEKRLAAIAAAEKAKKEAEQKQLAEEVRLAQKAKDDANPLYKDPEFNKDDYYDYEYASRVRRFHQPVQGTGYYDNYYTNNYWYSGNPAMYGNSIYANPTWGMMPSTQFNNFNSGFGIGYNTGYGSWNNGWNNNGWGNNNGWNNGWGNNGWNNNSNAYWAGYNQGYNNGWYGQPYGYGNGWNNNGWNNNGWNNNNGWGYYNSHDVNSGYSHVGPRGSMTGGNSSRSSYAGMSVNEAESASRTYFQNVITAQETTPKFTESPRRKIRESYTNTNSNINQGSEKVTEGTPTRGNTSTTNSQNEGGGLLNWTRNRIEESTNSNTTIQQNNGSTTESTPTRGGTKVQGGKINETPATDWNTNNNNSRNSGNSGNSGSGTSTPRGGDSGGTSRPR